jgi:flagellar basal-body rod protein FlgB
MADGTPAIIAGITREMKHLAARQQVIAQNIANSETPGYKARDLAAPDFADLLARETSGTAARVVKPRVSPSAGMTALGARGPLAAGTTLDRDVGETKPDGNNVTLEEQMLKMGRVQADFAAMTNLYRKQQALLRTALGKGN